MNNLQPGQYSEMIARKVFFRENIDPKLLIFGLTQTDLDSVRQNITHVKQSLDTIQSSSGMDFSNFLKFTTPNTVLAVKKSRGDAFTTYSDIKAEEAAAIKLGVHIIVPTYYVDEVMVQRFCEDDLSLSIQDLNSKREQVRNELMNKVGSIDGLADDNLKITALGPAILDVRSCHFSKCLARL